ncbi:MAG: 3-deoxy-8-phosphooctulonate synthase [Pseudodesulfovibrio sp.]|nr:3-deoxy-8-phosphooctulonate synthase [Pseudodesulfovibrio sp.]
MGDFYNSSRSGPFILAGPCVIENREITFQAAETLAALAEKLDLPLVFKSSFDKANRTSVTSFRGPGLDVGLEILAEVKKATGLPIVTDIHHPEQAARVAEVADVIQIPAFLCRQTDLLVAAAKTGKIINIKKGQFLAPWDMKNAVEKVRASGNDQIWLTERGSTYGYNNLVVDMRSIPEMSKFDVPVVFDATHSVQLPGGLGCASGGQREYVSVLASAAVAAGANGVFMEVHPDPDKALCDGPNSLSFDQAEKLLIRLKALWELNNG